MMNLTSHQLSALYRKSHDQMRNIDGLQPQEAFDELLKYLFLKENADEKNHRFPNFSLPILNQDLVSVNENLVKNLRCQFKEFTGKTNSWSSKLWQEKVFCLSDSALLGVHDLFEKINFSKINIDTRSAALNEFITSELRKGLGIFPTPDGVARMMVAIASPSISSRVLDPACGTGTFLIEIIRRWNRNRCKKTHQNIWGVDKSARMLLLSELNLGHNKGVKYWRALADSLYQSPLALFGGLNEGFDFILTNPPFGVVLDRDRHDITLFQTCKGRNNRIVKRQQSEVVFVEQCIKYLKPGGLLGIILPKSVVTNSSLQVARFAINTLGYLETIVNLPPETFCESGTQTNTVILFIRRYKTNFEKTETIEIASIDINNVGFDSTGRPRDGSQLEDIPKLLKAARRGKINNGYVRFLPNITKGLSISRLPDLLSGQTTIRSNHSTVPLKEFIEIATNGKTPGRVDYSSEGLFLVKVGNLTGQGINWEARDRNFISGIEEEKRRKNVLLMLREGDILLTSSAHSPVYIAKKIDVVGCIPKWVGGKASFVGEVMMLRPQKGIDPYILLAYLRLPSVQKQIQSMVRGQTAHLHPKDLLGIQIPKMLTRPPREFQNLVNGIKRQFQLSEKMNELVFEQKKISVLIENSILN